MLFLPLAGVPLAGVTLAGVTLAGVTLAGVTLAGVTVPLPNKLVAAIIMAKQSPTVFASFIVFVSIGG